MSDLCKAMVNMAISTLVVDHEFPEEYAETQVEWYRLGYRGTGVHDSTLVVCSDVERKIGMGFAEAYIAYDMQCDLIEA